MGDYGVGSQRDNTAPPRGILNCGTVLPGGSSPVVPPRRCPLGTHFVAAEPTPHAGHRGPPAKRQVGIGEGKQRGSATRQGTRRGPAPTQTGPAVFLAQRIPPYSHRSAVPSTAALATLYLYVNSCYTTATEMR